MISLANKEIVPCGVTYVNNRTLHLVSAKNSVGLVQQL